MRADLLHERRDDRCRGRDRRGRRGCRSGAHAFVAVTVNVYASPLVSPVMLAVVAGGLPDTWVAAWATPARYGVTV